MELWVYATIGATIFQTLRFMLQKQLSMGSLSTGGATFARFAYSAPLLAAVLAAWLGASDTELPALSARFWTMGAIGGLAQILATVCVVALFRERNFAVGITFKKTEVVQAALIGFIILGEGVSIHWVGGDLGRPDRCFAAVQRARGERILARAAVYACGGARFGIGFVVCDLRRHLPSGHVGGRGRCALAARGCDLVGSNFDAIRRDEPLVARL